MFPSPTIPLQDKIAAQLRSLQQQQREEDKHEFWTQLLGVLLVHDLGLGFRV